MPDPNTETEAKLQKLRERLQAGFETEYPAKEENLAIFRGAVRDEYEREQKATLSKVNEPPSPTKEREPEEPER